MEVQQKREFKKTLFFSIHFFLVFFLLSFLLSFFWAFSNFTPKILSKIWPTNSKPFWIQPLAHSSPSKTKPTLARYETFLRARIIDYQDNSLLLNRTYLDLLASGLASETDQIAFIERIPPSDEALMTQALTALEQNYDGDNYQVYMNKNYTDKDALSYLPDEDQVDLASLDLLKSDSFELNLSIHDSVFKQYANDPLMSKLIALSLARKPVHK